MAEYGCQVLWWDGGDQVGPIEPDDLPLSDQLKSRLLAWGQAYDAILNMDDPASSGFPSPQAQAAFTAEGQELLELLKQELGNGYAVRYQA
jgi:hypothetical protein